jgi:2-methylcitrate dehydratase PrpD
MSVECTLLSHGRAVAGTGVGAHGTRASLDAPRTHSIGGGASAPDRAALFNGALSGTSISTTATSRRETCHPSDNFGAVLAAAELAGADGATLLTALAVAYQVQCRLGDAAPTRQRGFDHATHLAYSVAAGVSRALSLDARCAANAIGIRRYSGEVHAQTAFETALGLQQAHGFIAEDVARVEAETFDVAHRIIGGGEEGDKTLVFTKRTPSTACRT